MNVLRILLLLSFTCMATACCGHKSDLDKAAARIADLEWKNASLEADNLSATKDRDRLNDELNALYGGASAEGTLTASVVAEKKYQFLKKIETEAERMCKGLYSAKKTELEEQCVEDVTIITDEGGTRPPNEEEISDCVTDEMKVADSKLNEDGSKARQ